MMAGVDRINSIYFVIIFVVGNCFFLYKYFYSQPVPVAEGVELDSYSEYNDAAPISEVVTEERLIYPGVRSSRSPLIWRDESEIHLPKEDLTEEGGTPYIRSLYTSGFLINGSHICPDLGKGRCATHLSETPTCTNF
uniref:Uncharacterized protein n=1 Tax=Cuerna arida TaxID=1464854 RepID=A0A1B6FS27_9HEMI